MSTILRVITQLRLALFGTIIAIDCHAAPLMAN
jgi:hypothetical protein